MKRFYSIALSALTVAVAASVAVPAMSKSDSGLTSLVNPQPAKAKVYEAKVAKVQKALDLSKFAGLKAKAPKKVAAQPADIAGDYEVSYVVELQNGGSYSGEMTVTTGSEENTVVLSFPFENSGNILPLDLIGSVNTEDGTITISADQACAYNGATIELSHWNSGWEDKTEIIATYTGTEIVFDQDDAIGLAATSGGYYTFFDTISMTKVVEDDPNADPNEGWTSLGNATFIDGWVLTCFGFDQMEYPWEVELQQNDENPNMYRLVDPYKGNCPLAEYNESTKVGYIQFDASDPDHVYFDTVEAGWAYASTGITKMYCQDMLSYFCKNYDMDPATVAGILGDDIPYTTFKDKVLTVPSGAACFGIQGASVGGYTWTDADKNAVNMFAQIQWPADRPTSVETVIDSAVTELTDGGTYYVYDSAIGSNDNRYGFFGDNSTEGNLALIQGPHINISDAYGKLNNAKYVWKAIKNDDENWEFQNVATGNYFGNTNNASATPAPFEIEATENDNNIFYVKNLNTNQYWNANYPAGDGITLSMWNGGHTIEFYTAVEDAETWEFASHLADIYTVTCEIVCNGNLIATETVSGPAGTEFSFTAPKFYTGEAISGTISQYNLAYTMECVENLPFKVSADVENATYEAIYMHSNEQHILTYNEEADAIYGYGFTANSSEAYTESQLFALIGSFNEGVKVYNKAAGKALQIVGTGTSATTALVDLDEATVYEIGTSDVAGENYFTLRPAGEPYLNLQPKNGNWELHYWSAADAGSTIWALGISQPAINYYNSVIKAAEESGIESLSADIEKAKQLVASIDAWYAVPEATSEALEAIVAKINQTEQAQNLRMYFEASYTGKELADWYINNVANSSAESFDAAYQDAINYAMTCMQSDMEEGFTLKNKRNGEYPGYADGVYNCGANNLNAYWKAEFTDDGNSVAALERTFYLYNVISETYLGMNESDSTALPAVADEDKDETAALLKVIAGNNGFEFIITNSGKENNFVNCNSASGSPIVTWSYTNDGGAFWIADQLPTFDASEQPIRVSFVGETTFGEWGEEIFKSIEGIQIKVPVGSKPTEIGELTAYTLDDEYNQVTIFSGKVADIFGEAEPATGNIAETIWNDKGEMETITTVVDVYTITLNPARTASGVYNVELSVAAFSLTDEDETSVYSPVTRNYAEIPGAGETFEIIVNPEAGTVTELNEITFSSYTGMAPNYNYTGEDNLTLKYNFDTVLLDLTINDMEKYDTFSWEDMSKPYYTIPVSTENAEGTYSLIIPEGFFENDSMQSNAEVLISWTIEGGSDGINTVTSVSVNGQVIYDLQGRRVNKAAKGIFIVNGEKTLVK